LKGDLKSEISKTLEQNKNELNFYNSFMNSKKTEAVAKILVHKSRVEKVFKRSDYLTSIKRNDPINNEEIIEKVSYKEKKQAVKGMF